MEKARHILLDISFESFPDDLEKDSFWEDLGAEALRRGEFSVLQDAFHRFEPQGFSAFWLLSESHLSVHSWPEEKKVFLDLFSCGNKEKTIKTIDFLISGLEGLGGKVEKREEVERGFIFEN